ncbi:heme-binding beta-barrel domain-containing protein [Vibrio campbellii]|uniref:heme-binding beta-barrel domain-containing protein n=1 Tax=Vibrio campbellii TaxID=680 RepID=UPI000CD3553E|nr:heme-binding beta-barrel domain-containing protein [Vibrio campbellii]AUW07506.1 hypothetical protein C1N51_28225 [Vibrio campbellii]
MKRTIIATLLSVISTASFAQESTVVNGLDLGQLATLVGEWKSAPTGGVDVAPAQDGTPLGKGGPAVELFYETMKFVPAADATNASDQYLTALYYEQEVFRKRDDKKFHDQRGYLIYDKKNKTVYNSFCIPRAGCIVAEGKAGNKISFATKKQGISQSDYMVENAKTNSFTMMLDFSEKDTLRYTQTTNLTIYGKPFSHTDSSTLIKIK